MGLKGVFRAATALGFLLVSSASIQAATTVGGAEGLTVSVESDGSYDIVARNPAWRFGGDIGSPLSNVSVSAGSDAGGTYNEISFDWQSGAPRHAAIRCYFNQRAVLFSATNPAAAANTFSFPTFTRYPKDLNHITFSGSFAFPSFYAYASESPWIFFDTAANAFVLSPVSNFMVAHTAWGPNGELESRISPKIDSLPEGFTQQTLLVVEHGINRAFETWGQAVTALHGKIRPANDADLSLNLLGYWTDAGSTYYYHTEPSLSYTETLAAVKADFDRQGIKLGYLQLDSWFYPKGPAADWKDGLDGIFEYFAAPPLFGGSLASFQQSIGTPLITHARWIDPSSPYRQQYKISGNVSTDPRYWADIARYLANSGVVTYEQDWLGDRAQAAFNLADPDAFLDNMASAMAQQNISMQYCMASPRHLLQSSRYNNVTTARVSPDRSERSHWRDILYASRLASALGVWPFTDVFMSAETDNLLVATLSAGPIGVGDRIGALNGENLLRAVRPDGVIVKPDVPLVPLDSSYLSDAYSANAPLVASTYSDFGSLRTHYLFAYNRGPETEASFRLSELGVDTPAYVYNYFEGAGKVTDPAATLHEPIADGRLYMVIAPIGISGIAMLGDNGHFVSMGKKRVTSYDDDGTVHLTIAFANGEASRTILGYSPDEPTAAALSGSLGPVSYDSQTGRFNITILPGSDATASLAISRAGQASPGFRTGPHGDLRLRPHER